MSSHRVGAVVIRILRQLRRDRRTLTLVFLAPLVLLSLLGYLLRGTGEPAHFAVVDSDRSVLSSALVAQLRTSGGVSFAQELRGQANSDLRTGRIAAYIVFPPGFGREVAQSHTVSPRFVLDGSEPGPAQSVMAAFQHALGDTVVRFHPDLRYVHGGPSLDALDYFGAGYIGIAVFFLVFVVTSVAFLRERAQGTLERLMASPTRRAELIVGYMLGYAVLASVQALFIMTFCLAVLHVYNAGSVVLIFVLVLLAAVGAVNLGIFLSMFAHTEFQAVQFIPLAVMPQLLLSGVLAPVSTEPALLQIVSHLLPLTYVVDGLHTVMIKGEGLTSTTFLLDAGISIGFAVLMLVGATLTLRRQLA